LDGLVAVAIPASTVIGNRDAKLPLNPRCVALSRSAWGLTKNNLVSMACLASLVPAISVARAVPQNSDSVDMEPQVGNM
jgi:hypothetical protein